MMLNNHKKQQFIKEYNKVIQECKLYLDTINKSNNTITAKFFQDVKITYPYGKDGEAWLHWRNHKNNNFTISPLINIIFGIKNSSAFEYMSIQKTRNTDYWDYIYLPELKHQKVILKMITNFIDYWIKENNAKS